MSDRQLTGEAFALFRHQHRLRLVEVLTEQSVPIDCQTVAQRLHDCLDEPQHDIASLEGDLYHTHFPCLEDIGLIRYDHGDGRLTDFDDDRLDVLLDTIEECVASLREDAESDEK